MSANGAVDQRSGFQRWVASLRGDSRPAALEPAPPVVSKREDGATQVHQVPKDLIVRLRAQAASKARDALPGERTAVFSVPPELLERARRALLAAEESTEASQTRDVPSADEGHAPTEFQAWTEASSGIALRPPGIVSRAERPGLHAPELSPGLAVPAVDAPLTADERADLDLPNEDKTLVFRHHAQAELDAFIEAQSGAASEAGAEAPPGDELAGALANAEVDALLSSPTDVPRGALSTPQVASLATLAQPSDADIRLKFRQPLGRQVGFVVVMLALAAFLVLASR